MATTALPPRFWPPAFEAGPTFQRSRLARGGLFAGAFHFGGASEGYGSSATRNSAMQAFHVFPRAHPSHRTARCPRRYHRTRNLQQRLERPVRERLQVGCDARSLHRSDHSDSICGLQDLHSFLHCVPQPLLRAAVDHQAAAIRVALCPAASNSRAWSLCSIERLRSRSTDSRERFSGGFEDRRLAGEFHEPSTNHVAVARIDFQHARLAAGLLARDERGSAAGERIQDGVARLAAVRMARSTNSTGFIVG